MRLLLHCCCRFPWRPFSVCVAVFVRVAEILSGGEGRSNLILAKGHRNTAKVIILGEQAHPLTSNLNHVFSQTGNQFFRQSDDPAFTG